MKDNKQDYGSIVALTIALLLAPDFFEILVGTHLELRSL